MKITAGFIKTTNNEEEIFTTCLREKWDGSLIVLKSGHSVCKECPDFYKCPDPTVIIMRGREN